MRIFIPFIFFFIFINEQFPYVVIAQEKAKTAPEETDDVEVYDPSSAPKGEAAASDKDEETIELNFSNADLRSIIREISEFTKKHIVFPDSLSGKATLFSPRPLKQDEVLEALVSLLSVKGWTIDKSNPTIWKIIKAEEVNKTSEIDKDGNLKDSDLYITSFIPIKYIDAGQIADTLKEMVSNMKVYKDTNTIIVTDTKSKVNRLKEMIAKLDKEGFDENIEHIRLKNAIAEDVARKLGEIIDIAGGSKKDTKFPFTGTGGESTEFKGRRIISKVIADPRTNSIIVKGNDSGIEEARKLIADLDSEITDEKQETRVFVYQLEHAEAESLASILSGVIKGIAPEKKSIFAKEEEGLTLGGKNLNVTADKKTNSLVIAGTYSGYQSIVPIIKKLDLKRKQVQIETTILEVTLSNDLNLGTSAGGGKQFRDDKGNVTGTLFGGTQFPKFSSSQTFSEFKDEKGNITGGSSMLAGITGMLLGFTTKPVEITKGFSIPGISAVLKANRIISDSKVLSKPSITVINNEKAKFEVGRTIYIQKQTYQTATNVQGADYTPEKVNLILEIEPKINAKDYVTMQINQEIRDTAPSSTDSVNPDITERKATTMTSAKSGETIVISGLIQDKISHKVVKVPILGDIPLFGYLFKTTGKKVEKTNILIFITPTVLNTSEDIARNNSMWVDRRNAFYKENGIQEDDWIGSSEHNTNPAGIVIENKPQISNKPKDSSILEEEKDDDGIVDIEFSKKPDGVTIK